MKEQPIRELIGLFEEDHSVILEKITEFKAVLIDFYESNQTKPGQKFSSYIDFFRNELPMHTKREEKDLLPLHEKLFPAAPHYRIILQHEHELINKVFQRFHRALKNLSLNGTNERKMKTMMLESGLTLVSLLRDHTTFEDHILFPELLEG